MKKLNKPKAKTIPKTVRVDESVIEFLNENAEEWGRDFSKQVNFVLGMYCVGNFEAMERDYRGPKAAVKRKKEVT